LGEAPKFWAKLAKEIFSHQNDALGFVILHEMDNLLYTSSALSFLLQNQARPITFTTGHNLFDLHQAELRTNIIHAFHLTQFNLNEIVFVFGNKIFRANQAEYSGQAGPLAFDAKPEGILGRIDFSVRLFDDQLTKSRGKIKFSENLNDRIEILDLSPMVNLKIISKNINSKNGLIINTNNYKVLPHDLTAWLQTQNNLPIIIWSQPVKNQIVAPKNIIVIDNMTWPTTLTKFMWALGQTQNLKKIREIMTTNVSREIFK
jgi:L-asparaginase